MTLPADLLSQMPMLACTNDRPPAELIQTPNRIFDVKWDGVRALAYVVDGKVTLRNKRGSDITRRYPDVVAHLASVHPTGQRVFDGEIVVCNPDTGAFDFELALRRDAQSKQAKIVQLARIYPATYIAFDLLWGRDGEDFRHQPLDVRLLHLSSEPKGLQRSTHSTDGPLMWSMVERFGFEGLVVKVPSATYHAGRHLTWTKAKAKKRCTAIVTGYERGEGGRDGQIGALYVSLLRDGEPVPVGKVGSGLRDRDHAPMLEVLRGRHEFLVEVEYLGLTSGGQLRHPVFKGVRSDILRADCTLSQIGR